MSQERILLVAKWIAFLSIGTFVMMVFFVLISRNSPHSIKGDMKMMNLQNREIAQSTNEYVSSDMGMASAPMMEGSDGRNVGKMMMASPTVSPDTSLDSTVAIEEKKIVRNGTLSMRVDDTQKTIEEIAIIVDRLGGSIVSSSINTDEPRPYPYERMNGSDQVQIQSGVQDYDVRNGMVTVRVPFQKFDEAMRSVRQTAKVVSNESSSSNDVTAQFIDLEVRMKNKRTEEETYVKILTTNAQKVSDILEITRELSRVRGEIEQLEAQQKFLTTQTDFSEISIFLTEDAQIGDSSEVWRPWQTVKDAVNHLFEQSKSFVDGIIYFVISVLPLFFLYIASLWLVFVAGRNVYHRVKMRK